MNKETRMAWTILPIKHSVEVLKYLDRNGVGYEKTCTDAEVGDFYLVADSGDVLEDVMAYEIGQYDEAYYSDASIVLAFEY